MGSRHPYVYRLVFPCGHGAGAAVRDRDDAWALLQTAYDWHRDNYPACPEVPFMRLIWALPTRKRRRT